MNNYWYKTALEDREYLQNEYVDWLDPEKSPKDENVFVGMPLYSIGYIVEVLPGKRYKVQWSTNIVSDVDEVDLCKIDQNEAAQYFQMQNNEYMSEIERKAFNNSWYKFAINKPYGNMSREQKIEYFSDKYIQSLIEKIKSGEITEEKKALKGISNTINRNVFDYLRRHLDLKEEITKRVEEKIIDNNFSKYVINNEQIIKDLSDKYIQSLIEKIKSGERSEEKKAPKGISNTINYNVFYYLRDHPDLKEAMTQRVEKKIIDNNLSKYIMPEKTTRIETKVLSKEQKIEYFSDKYIQSLIEKIKSGEITEEKKALKGIPKTINRNVFDYLRDHPDLKEAVTQRVEEKIIDNNLSKYIMSKERVVNFNSKGQNREKIIEDLSDRYIQSLIEKIKNGERSEDNKAPKGISAQINNNVHYYLINHPDLKEEVTQRVEEKIKNQNYLINGVMTNLSEYIDSSKYFLNKKELRSKYGQYIRKMFLSGKLDDFFVQKLRPGMTLKNKSFIHLDHIIPDSYFYYSSKYSLGYKIANSLSNIQPEWGVTNLLKSNFFIGRKKQDNKRIIKNINILNKKLLDIEIMAFINAIKDNPLFQNFNFENLQESDILEIQTICIDYIINNIYNLGITKRQINNTILILNKIRNSNNIDPSVFNFFLSITSENYNEEEFYKKNIDTMLPESVDYSFITEYLNDYNKNNFDINRYENNTEKLKKEIINSILDMLNEGKYENLTKEEVLSWKNNPDIPLDYIQKTMQELSDYLNDRSELISMIKEICPNYNNNNFKNLTNDEIFQLIEEKNCDIQLVAYNYRRYKTSKTKVINYE